METDYLVVGAGASGLAFADTLLAEAKDVHVTVVDRRHAPGGHWLQAYPFVRLHIPSAYYGVNSLALGEDRIDEAGENAGFYERATGEQVREYFADAANRLTSTGRVSLLTGHDHLGAGSDGEQLRDSANGGVSAVKVRRKIVDARYLEASIPATHTIPFDVASGARVIAPNDLPSVAATASAYAVLGSGKTAVDACMWLLDNNVEPNRIRWIRPRDAWFYDRRHFQPLEQVGTMMEGIALDAEAGATAASIEELFERLEDSGRLLRIDPTRPATMFRGTMLSAHELAALRQIEDVVRLGRVQRIEPDRILLDRGDVRSSPETLHVDCTALGLTDAPARPIFEPGRVTLQQVRHLSPCFNAALIAFLEAHRADDAERNRLVPPNPYPAGVEDWPRMMSRTWRTEGRWLTEPDLAAWVAGSRLHLLRALPHHATEPSVQVPLQLYLTHVAAAVERLGQLAHSKSAEPELTDHKREDPVGTPRVDS